MSLNATPTANRVHIAFFGKRNAGKSSIVNAITGQDLAVVSDVKGTTTDPVYKAMELLPIGPVVMIDTPGIDDSGALGALRVQKTKQVLNKSDIAVLIVDIEDTIGGDEEALMNLFEEKALPYLVVLNKVDRLSDAKVRMQLEGHQQTLKNRRCGVVLTVSALKGTQIESLKEAIAKALPQTHDTMRIVADLIAPSDFVVLVTPIDKAAPKGRLILPQQQTIRDILEADATAIVVKEHELKSTLKNLGKKPSLVITDSQVFAKVSADTPRDIPLTSFSILFARYKGLLDAAVEGAMVIDKLRDGDTVLMSEGCTHHRQCDDIGRVKLPRWMKGYTGKALNFEFTSGGTFPEDLSRYALVVHCGGCMLNEREVKYRQKCAQDQNIPITNYGVSIAYMQGILKRSIAMFPHLSLMFEDDY